MTNTTHPDMPSIYLDYAATSPLYEETAQALAPFNEGGIDNVRVNGNANSLYRVGRNAFDQLERARRSVAKLLGARRADEIIFTSGATEADNTALFGLVEGARERLRLAGKTNQPLQVITTAIEHDAVLAPARKLASQGVEVTYLNPNRQGFIEVRALEEVLTPNTVLVSIQMANSEVGAIQPIAELARVAHDAGSLFHTDAVQALGKTELNLAQLDVDAASFSAHKIGGPKGVGALYLRSRTPFDPYLLGGGQEAGRRSGTQNVAGAVGFAAALEATRAHEYEETARLQALRDGLYAALFDIEGVQATVEVEPGSVDFLPNIVHMIADDWESETMVLRFDQQGICVSGGSACSSHSLEPSHVLRSMGVPADEAYNALRVSMGRYTTEEDIAAFVQALQKVLNWEAHNNAR